ncbi:MAG: Rieske (2Fe-2S) protein [Chitinophagaceae bacterium]|nr:Rieske (2Fe-2S) protein [Chitinophagaceae bacterium]
MHCAAIMGAGLLLESCGSSMHMYKAQVNDKKIVVPLHEFPADKNMIVVRSKDMENDILLVKKDDHYNALYLQCTHEGVGLSATDKKIVCTAHGSVFDFDGNVLKEPALKPLKMFKTSVIDNSLIISLT